MYNLSIKNCPTKATQINLLILGLHIHRQHTFFGVSLVVVNQVVKTGNANTEGLIPECILCMR